MIRLINLTPHDIVLFTADAVVAVWSPAGTVARVREVVSAGPDLAADEHLIATARVAYAEDVDGLPDPTPGTGFIVSRVTAARVPERTDVWFPFPEKRIDGALVGCTGLAQIAPSAS